MIAATLRDVDRRRELLMATVQGVLILLGMLAVILLSRVQNGMTLRTTWFLVVATTLAVLARVWAVERFSPKVADVYARTLVLEFLSQVLELWDTDPIVRSAWRFHQAEFRMLRSVPAEELQVALEHLEQRGYRPPVTDSRSRLGFQGAFGGCRCWVGDLAAHSSRRRLPGALRPRWQPLGASHAGSSVDCGLAGHRRIRCLQGLGVGAQPGASGCGEILVPDGSQGRATRDPGTTVCISAGECRS